MPCVRVINRPGSSRDHMGGSVYFLKNFSLKPVQFLSFRSFKVEILLPSLLVFFQFSHLRSADAKATHLQILAQSSEWSARQEGDIFAELGRSAGNEFVLLLLPRHSNEIGIFLASKAFSDLSSSTDYFTMTFDNGDHFRFKGAHSKMTVTSDIDRGAVSPLTNDLATAKQLVISFSDGTTPAWTFQLKGASQTITALEQATRADALEGLPPPWGLPPYAASKTNFSAGAATAETCSIADGYSLRDAIEQANTPPGGGQAAQVVQLINWQMAQTTLGWACTVEVDFLGGSYQILAYQRLPNGRFRMQTQLMGQAPLN